MTLQNRRWMFFVALVVLGGLLALTACDDDLTAPLDQVPDEANDRIEITNDEGVLEQRVHYSGAPVLIQPDGPAPAQRSGPGVSRMPQPARAPSSLDLTLLAEVASPVVAGEAVQASAVWLSPAIGAVVSYNMRGATRLGALDYFIQLLSYTPRLVSSAAFQDADIHSLGVDGSYTYAAQASSDPDLSTPAVLERLRLRAFRFTLSDNLKVDLPSFAATSSVSTGDVVYATSGDGGGVYALDPDDLSVLGEYPLDDARWVAWDEAGGRIVVAQGTPGRISVFEEGAFPDGSMNLLDTFSFPGADIPESKSTVEIAGGKAFIAAGPDGVQIMCLDTGEIVGSVPRPDPASLGLDPSVVVTNSVTVEDEVMFISNGEAGVYAAAGDESFDSSACDAPQDITVLGSLQFGDLESANHVVYRRGLLFVAAGLGGVKVVGVD